MIVHSNVFGLTVAGIAIALLCLAQILDWRPRRDDLWRVTATLAITAFVISLALVLNRFHALG